MGTITEHTYFLPEHQRSDVESYQCLYCPNAVFLTSAGYLKHGRENHANNLEEIEADAEAVETYWKLTNELNCPSNYKIVDGNNGSMEVREEYFDYDEDGNVVSVVEESPNFQICQICGIEVNTNSANAIENHTKAHMLNLELKQRLSANWGETFVENQTCKYCQLVFSDFQKLIDHQKDVHSTGKIYVCKWCGFRTAQFSTLISHKWEAHEIPKSGRNYDYEITGSSKMVKRKQLHDSQRNTILLTEVNDSSHDFRASQNQITYTMNPPLGLRFSTKLTQGTRMPDSTGNNAEGSNDGGRRNNQNSITQAVLFKTSCPFCKMTMVKPSLLVRHIFRVHNVLSFESSIESKGMPDMELRVENGKVSFFCCGTFFDSRYTFMEHRNTIHSTPATE
uniref:C2H2-type domain-containing protein n=1 Tax=Parastrongyloides trichosuri TaxID=131310 RepID=A0A0N4Z6X3_PARTI